MDFQEKYVEDCPVSFLISRIIISFFLTALRATPFAISRLAIFYHVSIPSVRLFVFSLKLVMILLFNSTSGNVMSECKTKKRRRKYMKLSLSVTFCKFRFFGLV